MNTFELSNELMDLASVVSILKSTNIKDCIFITNWGDGWENDWNILIGDNGQPIKDIDEAIAFVRSKKEGKWVGLSDFDQMAMGNAMWDNI